MSLKLDLLLEAINEIDKEDVIEESAGKNGLIERAAYEKYKAEKKKNDDISADRAGRKTERDAWSTYANAKCNDRDNGQDKEYLRGGKSEHEYYGTKTANDIHNKIDSTNKRNSEKESSVNKNINKRAMGESVEDHITFADTLLELLD